MVALLAPARAALVLALLLACCAWALALAPSAQAANACQSGSATPSSAGKAELVRATVCLLNAERSRHGLAKLRLSAELSRIGERHAIDMARRNYFSHNSLNGKTFADRIRGAGYLRSARRWSIGENLAWGSGARATPSSIMRAWMKSPTHRANVLRKTYVEVGIGVAFDAPVRGVTAQPAGTYASEFGARY
ncbi:MAG TPA: CAP domain-containing protein [Thermoleophilaceae bacterium]|nr:CAP domain-containing protein [Thermoleophilaceae bacterium]